MKTLAAASIPAFLLLLGGGAVAQDAAPWALTFTHGPLAVHSVTYKDGSARAFYYFTFKLENKSAKDAPLSLHVRATVGSHPKKKRTHVAVPAPDAEESVRRIGRAPDLKNVQAINKMGTLKAGDSVRGIAVMGTFHREWDVATVLVSGLESAALHTRARKYGDAGYTVTHGAYVHHNARVLKKAGKDPEFTEVNAVIQHDVVWWMKYHREGDEFAPHSDPIILDGEGWEVAATKIVLEKETPFSKK